MSRPEHFIVFDLEATCWEGKPQEMVSEIIEIGAVKLDASGREVDEFQAFVKPVIHPTLSAFCTQLTTIEQAQVDQAEEFPAVCARFQAWIGASYWLCSWGFYDRKQLKQDCTHHQLDIGWLKPHISVKHQYADLHQLRRPFGLGGALKNEQLSFEGTPHRGIDDARNIARIFARYLDGWKPPK
ncbi:MAG: 3'-5' exonuclease [Bacteroidota bacterium]